MSKKNVEEKPQKAVFTRVGTNLQVGIVGLPNVGKSTFFNVITNSSVPAENFPFCTIDPSTSRVAVPDVRYDWLVDFWKPSSSVPAVLNITDIAGLVKGASEGAGLGNAFLSHIKAVDAIFHMIRVFEDEDITHVEGALEPCRDLEIISKELLLKDLSFMEAHINVLSKVAKTQKEKKMELETAEKVLEMLKAGKEIRYGVWKSAEIEHILPWTLLTAKPAVYLVNMAPTDYIRKKNKWLAPIKKWIDEKSAGTEILIPYSALFEQKISTMTPEEREKYCTENNIQSALPKIIKAGYDALDLVYFFTAGKDEVKCWTIKKGYKAPQAGGKIHTDFEKTFINCDVMRFEDFKQFKSEGACKANGKCQTKGKEYVVEDGDILFFRCGSSGSSSSKKK